MKNYTDLKLSTDPVVRESALRNEVRELRAALSDMEREVFSNLMSQRGTSTINVMSSPAGGKTTFLAYLAAYLTQEDDQFTPKVFWFGDDPHQKVESFYRAFGGCGAITISRRTQPPSVEQIEDLVKTRSIIVIDEIHQKDFYVVGENPLYQHFSSRECRAVLFGTATVSRLGTTGSNSVEADRLELTRGSMQINRISDLVFGVNLKNHEEYPWVKTLKSRMTGTRPTFNQIPMDVLNILKELNERR